MIVVIVIFVVVVVVVVVVVIDVVVVVFVVILPSYFPAWLQERDIKSIDLSPLNEDHEDNYCVKICP